MAEKPTRKWRTGKVYAVPCPWEDCHKVNDFRDVADYGLDKGNIFSCDHCGRNMKVVKVEPTTLVSVMPTEEQGNLKSG
jgi:hypothetical protein